MNKRNATTHQKLSRAGRKGAEARWGQSSRRSGSTTGQDSSSASQQEASSSIRRHDDDEENRRRNQAPFSQQDYARESNQSGGSAMDRSQVGRRSAEARRRSDSDDESYYRRRQDSSSNQDQNLCESCKRRRGPMSNEESGYQGAESRWGRNYGEDNYRRRQSSPSDQTRRGSEPKFGRDEDRDPRREFSSGNIYEGENYRSSDTMGNADTAPQDSEDRFDERSSTGWEPESDEDVYSARNKMDQSEVEDRDRLSYEYDNERDLSLGRSEDRESDARVKPKMSHQEAGRKGADARWHRGRVKSKSKSS